MKLSLPMMIRMRAALKETKFRRPLEGLTLGTKETHDLWSNTNFGQLVDEETTKYGQTIPMRQCVPVIMAPDLSNCELKPYVTYQVEKESQPAVEAKDLFNAFYAPNIQADLQKVPLEELPEH